MDDSIPPYYQSWCTNSVSLLCSTPMAEGGFIPSFFEGSTPPSVVPSSQPQVITVDQYPSVVKESRWVLGLTEDDRCRIISGTWLSDNIVDAGQQLIQQKFPDVAGLQCICLGQKLQFTVSTTEFIQILHDGSNHWITISTIGCVSGEVILYDSISKKPTRHLEAQIASLIHTHKKSLTIR